MTRLTLNNPTHESIQVDSGSELKNLIPTIASRPVMFFLLAVLIITSGVILIYLGSWLFVIIFFSIIALGFGVPSVLALTILYPRRTQSQVSPTSFGIDRWEDVQFASPDGVTLSGWFVPPERHGDGAALVFAHGLRGNRGHMLREAAIMVAKGYGALLFDFRNHGKSGKSVTTLGYAEAQDVQGAFAYLLTRAEINSERIGLVGFSMGGAAVLRAAAHLPQVKAVVAESTFTSLEDNVVEGMLAQVGLPSFPFAPFMLWLGERLTGLRMGQLRPIDDVARIAPRPVLFVHGACDHTVQALNSVKLFETASNPKGLYVVPNMNHADRSLVESQEYDGRISGFLDWAVRGIDRRQHPRVSKL